MGCILACFRVKESRPDKISPPKPVVPRRKNALSSLFLSDDESLRKEEEGRILAHQQHGVKEKFVKTCGTLFETSTEIPNVSDKRKDKPAQYREEKSSKLNSWLTSASTEELKQEKHSDEASIENDVKICEDWVARKGSLVRFPGRHNTGRVSSSTNQRSDIKNVSTSEDMRGGETCSETSSVSPLPFASSARQTIKSDGFDCESDRFAFSSKGSSPECARQQSKQSGLAGGRTVAKPSPYPTLSKSTDETQIPAAVFPAYRDDVASGKVSKDRPQYAFGVLDTVENPSQPRELKDKSSDHLRESIKLNGKEILIATPTSESVVEHSSVGKEMENDGSLSSWFKPYTVRQDDNNIQFNSASAENVYCGKTPGDRPILGMVAAYWNDDETSHITPNWWDGNGIPNSTNKYKEDQKVSWHATPFEERLEKALSEETSICQRNPISSTPPVEFNDNEESDTALSHLQPPSHFKSVVSV